MKVTLDPVTQAKIEAFGRRRRWIILARGICAVLTFLLAAMTAVAFIDLAFILPDEARYALSGLAYGAAFFAAWYTCARLVWRTPDSRELARFFEQVRPELREDLLSAVELGRDHLSEKWESPEFNRLLQDNVAARIRDVHVKSLLSFRSIRRWVMATGGVVAGCIVLLFLPGVHFRHQLTRALLPMVNLARISDVEIKVMEPGENDEYWVPQGDTVTIRVKTKGPETPDVSLEIFPESGKTSKIKMIAEGKRVYSSSVAVGREPVRYRIRARRALTKKYLLTPVPRPGVAMFHKTYTYPEYTRKDPRPVTERTGDLEELEGSVVDLDIQVNRPVKTAELRIEQAGKQIVTKLEIAGERVKGRVELTASGTYKVHLVDAETGFENKFSPQYEIRPKPDLVPRVVLEAPVQNLILPPDEIVQVIGTATDDLGLEKVVQVVRLNQENWKEVPFEAGDPGVKQRVTRRWDLYEMGVQPGDLVTMKLAAIDLKGNRAETKTVLIEISAPGFDPRRHVPLAAKEAAYNAIAQLLDDTKALEKKVREIPSGDEDPLKRRQAMLNVLTEAEQVADQAELAENTAKVALKLSRAGRESDDLVSAARLVRRMKEVSLAAGRAEMERASGAEDEAVAKAALQKSRAYFQRAASEVGDAEKEYREILAAEEAIAALNDLRDLMREMKNINLQVDASVRAKDAKVWERLARRLTVSAKQSQAVENLFQVMTTRAERGLGRRAQQIRQQIERIRTNTEKALGNAPDGKLHGVSRTFLGNTESAFNNTISLERELARRAVRSRKDLLSKSKPSWEDVRETGREIQRLADAQKRLDDARAKNADAEKTAALRREARDQSARGQERWRAAGVQLEARAAVEETRSDSDPFFVADSGLASRALEAVLEKHLANPKAAESRKTLEVVEKAYRTLETGHEIVEISATLRALAEKERWPGLSTHAKTNRLTRHTKDWAWLEEKVKALDKLFQQGGLPREAAQALIKAWQGPAGNPVRREMQQRQNLRRAPATVAADLERLGAEVGKAMTKIQPPMDEARRILSGLVPSLPERLRQLAEAANELKEQSTELAKEAPQEKPQEVQPEAQDLLENQVALDEQLDQVMNELRRDANTQDLFTKQGREAARDAEDAVAMVQEAPEQAEQALRQAAESQETQTQESALQQASEQQQELSKALTTLAEHYENAEKGKPEETRPDLRAAEEALGIREEMDKKYQQMERLAELAKMAQQAETPQQLAEAQQALANEVQGNEAAQRQLEQLAQNQLDQAAEALKQAAQREEQAAQQLANAKTQEAQKAQTVEERAAKIAKEARQMAKTDVPQLQREAQKANAPKAQPQLEQAKQNLQEGANEVPKNFENPQAAAQELREAAQELNEAAQNLQNAQKEAQQAANKAQQNAGKEQQQAQAAQKKAQQETAQAKQAQQQSQKAQQAEEAADKAAAQTQKKAEQAQKAAKAQPNNQELAKAAQQAQQQAQKAQQAEEATDKAAAQAQKKAQQEQAQAQQAQKAAQQEQAQANQAAQQAKQAQKTVQQAGQEKQQAQQLAQKAEQLANELQGQQAQTAQVAQQAQQAAQQAQELLQQAESEIQKAAQLQQMAAREQQAEALQQIAKGVEGVAQQEVPQAQQAAQQAANAAQPQAAQQAAKAAQEAAKAAQQAAQQAQQAAQQAGQQQNPQAQQSAQQAQQAAQQAQQAAQQAAQASQQARNSEAQQQAQAAAKAAQQAAQQAQQAAQQAGQQQSGPAQQQAQAAQKSAQQAAEAAQAAVEALAQAGSPQQAQQAAQAAQAAIEAQAQQLAAARQAAEGQPAQAGEAPAESTLSDAAAQFLAQALSELQNAMQSQGQPGQPSQQPGQPGQQPGQGQSQAAQAIESAAQAQAQSMRQAMAQGQPGQQPGQGQQGQQPGDMPFSQTPGDGSGASVEAGALPYVLLPDALRLSKGVLKLPPRLAKDLLEARRESVSPEYRHMIQTYLKVIAEKAAKGRK